MSHHYSGPAGTHGWVLPDMGGYSQEEAKRVAETLLPDVLRYDPSRPVGYPDNGLLLTDDVADPFMAVLTNGKVSIGQLLRLGAGRSPTARPNREAVVPCDPGLVSGFA